MNLPPELFLVAMFVLMYFLLIRPQQKRAKDHKKLLSELKKGDESCYQWRRYRQN